MGLGASSISEAPGGYLQNQPDPARYAESRETCLTSYVRGLQRGSEERRIAARIDPNFIVRDQQHSRAI